MSLPQRPDVSVPEIFTDRRDGRGVGTSLWFLDLLAGSYMGHQRDDIPVRCGPRGGVRSRILMLENGNATFTPSSGPVGFSTSMPAMRSSFQSPDILRGEGPPAAGSLVTTKCPMPGR